MGHCAGGAVYSPAITDFVMMVNHKSHMFITGPEVIKTVTKEDVTKEDLGGAYTHNATSGVAHLMSESDQECLATCRRLLSFIPQNNLSIAPRKLSSDLPDRKDAALNSVVPENPNLPYDIRKIVYSIADEGDFFEIQPLFAQNIVIGFIRLNGYSVGVVANQPQSLAGCLDNNASIKAARFVRFCDAFNVPILTLVDVPGFLPGVQQEHGGIIRNGAKLLYAFAEATVPKVTIITRKAYGGAYDVMASKHIRADFNFAYPTAEIAVMGPEGAVNIIFKREIDGLPEGGEREARRKELVANYRETFANPWKASELGFLDGVIAPEDTRSTAIRCFELLQGKQQLTHAKKHGNIPL
jgi:propionyl-CoA carboxylase beta chain